MLASHNNAAGRVGYVRAVFSERARGFAAPVDLLRVVLRVANRIATRQRIGEAFKGYLVSESGQVLPMFTASREKYVSRLEYDYTTTSGSWCYAPHVRYCDEAGGAIDAPKWIAAGCMSSKCREYVGLAVLRAGS